MIVVCDIDGTVADNGHRQGFLQQGKKDWDSFYDPKKMAEDSPVPLAAKCIGELLAKVRAPNFFFLTGRPERTREVTELWLAQHTGIVTRMPGITLPAPHRNDHLPQLLMRGDHDYRAAMAYKEDFCQKLDGCEPALFFDDDERNKYMYSRYGIFLKAPECWEVFR